MKSRFRVGDVATLKPSSLKERSEFKSSVCGEAATFSLSLLDSEYFLVEDGPGGCGSFGSEWETPLYTASA